MLLSGNNEINALWLTSVNLEHFLVDTPESGAAVKCIWPSDLAEACALARM